jgi:hypothetical protein
MFSFFQARCPVDPVAKTWIEGRLAWLNEQFGDADFLGRPPIAPTRANFPELFRPGGIALRELFERVCTLMHVDSARVELEVMAEWDDLGFVNQDGHAVGGAAGYYIAEDGRERIQVSPTEFLAPTQLIATMAHELSHLRLLGDGRLDGDTVDNELVTDLCAFHHGFGIFLANGPRAWVSQLSQWPGTHVLKPEYMPAPYFGWALAHQAWLRGERKPEWFAHVSGDSLACAREGLRYLGKTSDSAFATQDWSAWEALHPRLVPPRQKRRKS